ncbi:MAG: WG repeat-containing protein [Bacteroidales bacterium]|nr:WG repeat-containing protein [Bacteroidales bacterium]MDY2916150.1 WG repeat-containing protein [Muribaculaceae bacterium]
MPKARVCKYCGKYLLPGEQVCHHCGGRVRTYGWLWLTLAFLAVVGAASIFVWRAVVDKDEAAKEGDQLFVTPEFTERVRAYEELTPFSENLAAVCRDGRWGYIDAQGNEVIACQYTHAAPFHGGVGQVTSGRTILYINAKGERVDGGVRNVSPAVNSPFAVFQEEGRRPRYGVRDANGNVVVQPLYDSLSAVSQGIAVAVLYTEGIRGRDIEAELAQPLPILLDPDLDVPVRYMTDSALNADTQRLRHYGYVDMRGATTFTPEDFERATTSRLNMRRYAERQQRLRALENERIDRLRIRREQQMQDSIDAIIALGDISEEPSPATPVAESYP